MGYPQFGSSFKRVSDSFQICAMPADRSGGTFLLHAFYNEHGNNLFSSGSYYFPFHSMILDAISFDDSSGGSDATLNTVYKIHHNYSLISIPEAKDSWDALVSDGYELKTYLTKLSEESFWKQRKDYQLLSSISDSAFRNMLSSYGLASLLHLSSGI